MLLCKLIVHAHRSYRKKTLKIQSTVPELLFKKQQAISGEEREPIF